MSGGTTQYILGHTPDELRRLELQAGMLEPITKRVLQEAGLREGMSVLDIGTGAGDVAMLAATIVGPTGHVRGIDRSAAALEHARSRAASAGLGWLSFDEVALTADLAPRTYDFVVGRYVVMHQPDPAAFIRSAAACAKLGGVVAFVEIAQVCGDRFSVPPVAAYDTMMNETLAAFSAANADLDVGSKMTSVFARAGLPQPNLTSEITVGASSSVLPEWMARTHHNTRPAAEAEQTYQSTLADRARSEAAAAHAQLFGPRNVAVWSLVKA